MEASPEGLADRTVTLDMEAAAIPPQWRRAPKGSRTGLLIVRGGTALHPQWRRAPEGSRTRNHRGSVMKPKNPAMEASPEGLADHGLVPTDGPGPRPAMEASPEGLADSRPETSDAERSASPQWRRAPKGSRTR